MENIFIDRIMESPESIASSKYLQVFSFPLQSDK